MLNVIRLNVEVPSFFIHSDRDKQNLGLRAVYTSLVVGKKRIRDNSQSLNCLGSLGKATSKIYT
jgi:hypothetical protein